MYYHYYLLHENPFTLTPDPKYLWMSESHKEALASMIYGVQERKGFVLILGEVGTGKTTLIRHVLSQFGTHISTAFIFNSVTCFEDLLYMMLQDLEVPCESRERLEMVTALNAYLLREATAGRAVVLILDEAQHLSLDILEELRMLSNLETNHAKLLQIILVGQPELTTKLESPALRQLRQRIALVVQLKPLVRAETRQYIAHRLTVAGFAGEQLFRRAAVRLLHRASHGIPRLINVIADQALIMGYSTDTSVIGRRIVKRVVQDHPLLRLNPARLTRATHTTASQHYSQPSKRMRARRAAALLLPLVIVAGLMIASHRQSTTVWPRFSQALEKTQTLWTALMHPVQQELKSSRDSVHTVPDSSTPQGPPLHVAPPSAVSSPSHQLPEAAQNGQQGDSRDDVRPAQELGGPSLAVPTQVTTSGTPEASESVNEVVVQPGEYLAMLTRRIYGRSDLTLLDFVKMANPNIENIDTIAVGQRLRFPPLRPATMVHQGPDALYRVHLLTVSDADNGEVESLRAKLEKLGHRLHVIPVQLTSDAQTWYRIMAGDFADREQAAQFYQAFWMPMRAVKA